MVEVVGHKLKTHHPVIEPVSDSEAGTEFFDAETEGPDPPFCLAETDAETRTNSKKPAVHGTNARACRLFVRLPDGHDWVEGNCLVCHQIAGAHLRNLIKMLRGPHQ